MILLTLSENCSLIRSYCPKFHRDYTFKQNTFQSWIDLKADVKKKKLLKEAFKNLKDKYLLFYAKKERKKEKDRLFPTYNNKITFKNTIIYITIHCFFKSSIQILDTASDRELE